jgi:hypothetical protein
MGDVVVLDSRPRREIIFHHQAVFFPLAEPSAIRGDAGVGQPDDDRHPVLGFF